MHETSKRWPQWAEEMFEERVAIMVYDGELSLEEAERKAIEEVEDEIRSASKDGE